MPISGATGRLSAVRNFALFCGTATMYRSRTCRAVIHRSFPNSRTSNRRPTRAEVRAARPYLDELTRGRRVVAVGRLAAEVLAAPYVRHPSHGGATKFAEGLRRTLAA